MREEEPTFARWVGGIGLLLVTVGSVALLVAARQVASRFVGPGLGSFFFIFGLACLLFHAVRETDAQVRRVYGILGFLFLGAGILVSVLPIRGAAGTQFLPYGFLSMTLALLFLLPFLRNETQVNYRQSTLTVLGLVGAILAGAGFVGGNVSENFLLPYGLLLTLLGLFYLWAFVGVHGSATEIGYRVALALGFGGLVFLLMALGRSFVPWLLYWVHLKSNQPEPYFVPAGLLHMTLAVLYIALAVSMCSDNRFVILTRRELAAFFYSPIAYFVFFAMTIGAFWIFYNFVNQLFVPVALGMEPKVSEREPILVGYVISWFVIILTLFIVPVLTMRLLSEEARTGTLEVLFTAPVTELSVVMSKFVAAFIFFLLSWVPAGLYLIALRIEGGQPFEYRPLLTFGLALACSGAAFVSMGLFCSSLTRNQIIAVVLGLVGMLFFFALFFIWRGLAESQQSGNPLQATTSTWASILEVASFVNLWITSMEGQLAPRQLVFQASAAVFFLFLTVKVLESRKWR